MASIRDLHIRTSELVRDAAGGAVIIIERRGEPVAELRPLSKVRRKPKLPDMTRFQDLPQLPVTVPGSSKKTAGK
jgi:antitoxin (DNA-binding transcriptional repressor) of toxin-antitoxin stability system